MEKMPVNIVTQGVVTRSVRDTVAFYQEMAVLHPNTALAPIGPTRPIEGLRIAMVTSGLAGLPVDPQVREAVEKAGALCSELGHHVEPVDNPFPDQIAHDFLRYWGMLAFSLRRFGSFSVHLSSFFASIAPAVPGSIRRLRRFAADYDDALSGFDLILSPVLATPPVPIGYLGPEVDPRVHLIRLLRYASFTALQNVSGAPGISLPLASTPEGLPIGIHFGARFGQEQTLLDLAAQLELAQPWQRPDQ